MCVIIPCEDKEALRAFILAHDKEFLPPMSEQEEDLLAYIDWLLENGGFLVEKREEKIVGVVGFRKHDARYGSPYISYLAIVPELRRQGIGQALMEACLNQLTQHGDKVVLRTWSTNEASLGLYNKLGFSHREVIEHDRGENIHTIFLEKKLGE